MSFNFLNLKEFGDSLVKRHFEAIKNVNEFNFIIVMYKNNQLGFLKPRNYFDKSPMDHAQEIIDKFCPEMYIVISEGWMKIVEKNENHNFHKNYRYGMIQNDPQKKEVLIFTGKNTITNEKYSRLFKIKRDNSEISYEEMLNDDGAKLNFESEKLR